VGRKRREKGLPQEIVRLLDGDIGFRAREPDPPLVRARKFLERMATEFSDLARLPDSKLKPGSTYEYATRVLAYTMEEALGEDMTCRIFARFGKPRGKSEGKWERQRRLIGLTFGQSLGSVVEWLAANPEKAEWFGMSTGDHETIKQQVLRLRERAEKEMAELIRIDAAKYYSEFFPKG
jgi:hypothetical protein